MTFPTIPTGGRVVTGVQADNSATRTFPSLTGLTKNKGDLLVAIIVGYQSSLTSAIFSAWGASFIEIRDIGVASNMCVGVAYKISDGTETGTFTVTQGGTVTGHAAFILLSIPGAHTTTAPEVSAALANGTAAAADPASLDPAWAAEDTLWVSILGSGETGTGGVFTGTASAPANYGNYAETSASADAIGAVQAAVSFRQLNAASEDVSTGSVDLSNARNCAFVIAVRPAPTVSGSLTADAIKRATLSASITADAVIRKTQAGSFTADAVKRTERSASVTADSTILRTQPGTLASDAVLRRTQAASLVADAIVQKTQFGSITLDAVIATGAQVQTGAFTAEAIIRREGLASLGADAIVRREQAGAVTVDAVLLRTQGAVLTASAVVQAIRTGQIAAEAIVKRTASATVTTDAVLRATSTGSVTADAVIRKTVSAALTASAVILRPRMGGFAADAILLSPRTGSVTADAVVRTIRTGVLTADATVRRTQPATLTVDAILRSGRESDIVADAVIRRERTGSFTVDAWVVVPGSQVGGFTADAVIRRSREHSLTADAVVRITRSGAIVADALLRRISVGSFGADAIVLRSQTGAVTAQAVVRRERAATIAADAVIRTARQGSFAIDAVIVAGFPSFTIDAVVRRIQARSFSIDAVIAGAVFSATIEPEYIRGSSIELEGLSVLSATIEVDLIGSYDEIGGVAVAEVEVIEGDSAPPIIGTIRDAALVPVPLGLVASVKFQMRRVGDRRYTVNAAAEIIDAPNGKVRYTWAPNDLDRPGDYEVQWELTYAAGGSVTTQPPNTLKVKEQ